MNCFFYSSTLDLSDSGTKPNPVQQPHFCHFNHTTGARFYPPPTSDRSKAIGLQTFGLSHHTGFHFFHGSVQNLTPVVTSQNRFHKYYMWDSLHSSYRPSFFAIEQSQRRGDVVIFDFQCVHQHRSGCKPIKTQRGGTLPPRMSERKLTFQLS